MAPHPRKRFGQNFLQDAGIIHDILVACAPKPNDLMVEIGPGRGALTTPLLMMCHHLHVIEIDRDLVQHLRKTLPELPATHLIHDDVLDVDFAQWQTDARPLRIIGNLPYNISTPLLFHLLTAIEHISDIHIMLQKEVGQRILAEPHSKHYGRLSIMLGVFLTAEYLFDVPPEAFYPIPQVDSCFLRLRPRQQPRTIHNFAHFSRLVRLAFNQRRKTLRNALRSEISLEHFEAVGLSGGERAEHVSIDDYIRLSDISDPHH